MCVCTYTNLPRLVGGGQRTTFGNQFSPFYMWVLGIKFKPAGLAGSVFTH